MRDDVSLDASEDCIVQLSTCYQGAETPSRLVVTGEIAEEALG